MSVARNFAYAVTAQSLALQAASSSATAVASGNVDEYKDAASERASALRIAMDQILEEDDTAFGMPDAELLARVNEWVNNKGEIGTETALKTIATEQGPFVVSELVNVKEFILNQIAQHVAEQPETQRWGYDSDESATDEFAVVQRRERVVRDQEAADAQVASPPLRRHTRGQPSNGPPATPMWPPCQTGIVDHILFKEQHPEFDLDTRQRWIQEEKCPSPPLNSPCTFQY